MFKVDPKLLMRSSELAAAPWPLKSLWNPILGLMIEEEKDKLQSWLKDSRVWIRFDRDYPSSDGGLISDDKILKTKRRPYASERIKSSCCKTFEPFFLVREEAEKNGSFAINAASFTYFCTMREKRNEWFKYFGEKFFDCRIVQYQMVEWIQRSQQIAFS